MSNLQGNYRSAVTKGGPRVLTFAADISPIVNSNCPDCPTSASVAGEGGGAPLPLVHGWYEIQTDVDIFWQQVNPADACAANPFANGGKLGAGACAVFFVDAARRDGILVIGFCATVLPVIAACPNSVRVLRKDTIMSMADTGENADLPSPEASDACG